MTKIMHKSCWVLNNNRDQSKVIMSCRDPQAEQKQITSRFLSILALTKNYSQYGDVPVHFGVSSSRWFVDISQRRGKIIANSVSCSCSTTTFVYSGSIYKPGHSTNWPTITPIRESTNWPAITHALDSQGAASARFTASITTQTSQSS